jgi:hypothetical protein
MRGDLAGIRPAAGAAAVVLAAAALSLAGCGSSGGSAATAGGASGSSAPGAAASSVAALPTGSTSEASGGSASPLSKSRMRVLTKLKKSQLCGLVGPAEASKMLGTRTAPPVYANRLGLGITCQWVKKGQDPAGADELYVGISSIIDWTGAKEVDKLLRTTAQTVAGHPALAAGQQGKIAWAQVDVALGGDNDPVAEYRAPTLAGALALARALTPRIVAMG